MGAAESVVSSVAPIRQDVRPASASATVVRNGAAHTREVLLTREVLMKEANRPASAVQNHAKSNSVVARQEVRPTSKSAVAAARGFSLSTAAPMRPGSAT